MQRGEAHLGEGTLQHVRIGVGCEVSIEEGAWLGLGGAGRRHVGGVTRRVLADADHAGPPVVTQRKPAAHRSVAQSATFS